MGAGGGEWGSVRLCVHMLQANIYMPVMMCVCVVCVYVRSHVCISVCMRVLVRVYIRAFVFVSWHVHLLVRLEYELRVAVAITGSSVFVTFRRFVRLCLDLLGCCDFGFSGSVDCAPPSLPAWRATHACKRCTLGLSQ